MTANVISILTVSNFLTCLERKEEGIFVWQDIPNDLASPRVQDKFRGLAYNILPTNCHSFQQQPPFSSSIVVYDAAEFHCHSNFFLKPYGFEKRVGLT